MPRHQLVFACLLSLAAVAFGMGCKANDNGGSATATQVLQPTATEPAATAGPDIRQQDLTQQAGLHAFLTSSGGTANRDSIIYADVTGDHVDDAVVPVSSGGEGGNIALFVYGYQPSGIEELLHYVPDTRLQASVEGGRLTITEPVSAPGDPLCCPSELKQTTYSWDGAKLVVAGEQTVPATPGQKP